EIIEYDCAAGTTQTAERLFVEFGPRARAGLKGEQANGLAAVAQREHEQACTPVTARERIAHHRTATVIDLRFLGWWRNDDRTRGLCRLSAKPADKAFDAGVAPREAVAVHQVLIDGLGVSSFAQRQFDEVEVGLAGTARW